MSVAADLLTVFGFVTGFLLVCWWVDGAPSDRRERIWMTVAWGVALGPFVLRTWVEALLS